MSESDKKYVLTGNYEQLVSTIKRTFDIEEDGLARFIIDLSIMDRITEAPEYGNDRRGNNGLDTWYEQTNDSAMALIRVNGVPISITLSDLKVSVAESLFLGLGPYFVNYCITGSPGDFISVGTNLVFQFIVALWRASIRLDKNYACVCKKIADSLHGNNRDWFTMNELLPKRSDMYGKFYCDQAGSLKTCEKRHKEFCRVTEDEILEIIKDLKEKKVLIDGREGSWRLRK